MVSVCRLLYVAKMCERFSVRVFNCLRGCGRAEGSLYILIILQMSRICVKEWTVQ